MGVRCGVAAGVALATCRRCSGALSTAVCPCRFSVNKRIFVVGFGLYGSIHGPTDYQVNIQVCGWDVGGEHSGVQIPGGGDPCPRLSHGWKAVVSLADHPHGQ